MNILIVDDKYDVVQGIKEGVDWSSLGEVNTFEAYSGLEALETARSTNIDLLITDIEMPGLSGIDLAERVRQESPQTGIIFLSSHDSFRFAQAAIRIGCYEYILQPVDYGSLSQSIRKALAHLSQKASDFPERPRGNR